MASDLKGDSTAAELLAEAGGDRRALGERLRRERDGDPLALRAEVDPLDAKLLGEWALTKTAGEWLDEIEQQARQRPDKAYVSLPGDWGRVLFIVKERDRFVGYEQTHGFGGGMCGRVYTRTGGELDYFMAGPLGVQRLTRETVLALLATAITKGE